MVGRETLDERCHFTSCEYLIIDEGYHDADFLIEPHDAAEWGIEKIGNSALDVWDQKPQEDSSQ